MITGFVSFVAKWENLVEQHKDLGCPGKRLLITTDNKCYDPARINQLIERYMPGHQTLPYKMTKLSYGAMIETHSMQYGLLMGYASTTAALTDRSEFLIKFWGMSKAMEDTFDIKYNQDLPESKITHDHMAENDAYTIAREYQVCLAVYKGQINPKVNN
jgi:hypothetical protein